MQKMCAICGTIIHERDIHYTTNGVFLHSVYTDEKGFKRHCYDEYNQRVLKDTYSIDKIRKSGW